MNRTVRFSHGLGTTTIRFPRFVDSQDHERFAMLLALRGVAPSPVILKNGVSA